MFSLLYFLTQDQWLFVCWQNLMYFFAQGQIGQWEENLERLQVISYNFIIVIVIVTVIVTVIVIVIIKSNWSLSLFWQLLLHVIQEVSDHDHKVFIIIFNRRLFHLLATVGYNNSRCNPLKQAEAYESSLLYAAWSWCSNFNFSLIQTFLADV